MRAAVDVPILANMTEFGKSELCTVGQLAEVGVNLVIFPVSLLRLAMGAAERALDTLAADGTLRSLVPSMQTRARLYELLDYEAYNRFDSGVYDFTLGDGRADCDRRRCRPGRLSYDDPAIPSPATLFRRSAA